jgi:squalene-associated FAD-dependent desaturase
MTRFDVAVVGGGFAGLSAACALAANGARVVVADARPQLGGRATAFTDRETGELVDNGQHVLFGCYRATLAFLRQIGAQDNVRMHQALELVCYDRAGTRSVLRCPSLPAPLHLLAGVLDWDPIPWSDRFSALRLAGPLLKARRALEAGRAPIDELGGTVNDWLRANGQGPTLMEWLWEPLAVAALNQSPEHAACTPFLRVLAEMFGPDPSAASIVLPAKPLHQMYAEPARAFIIARGGRVETSALARLLVSAEHVAGIEIRGERIEAPAVVCAVPWFALRPFLGPGAPAALAHVTSAADAMASMPIVTVNLWYDRPVMSEAFAGLPGRQMQWVFDKRQAFGESVSHLSLVSSGATDLVGRPNADLAAAAAAEVAAALPGARGARLVRGTVIREKRATFSLAPGQPARPGPRTGVRGLYLAGDWTDTGLPATIESAVVSGRVAAELCEAER